MLPLQLEKINRKHEDKLEDSTPSQGTVCSSKKQLHGPMDASIQRVGPQMQVPGQRLTAGTLATAECGFNSQQGHVAASYL